MSKSTVNRTPAINIAENDNEFQIELAVPGLKREDFKINLEQDQLSVSAEKRKRKQRLMILKSTTDANTVIHRSLKLLHYPKQPISINCKNCNFTPCLEKF